MEFKELVKFAYDVRNHINGKGFQCACLIGGKEISVAYPTGNGFLELKIIEEIAKLPVEEVANSIIQQIKEIN